jgi:type I restriction enzyme, S subunit
VSQESDDGLPPGWVSVSLAALSQINPPLDRCIVNDAVEVNFVPMRAVESEGAGLVRPEVRRYGDVKKGYTSFLSGDVITAKITPCMENGKTTTVPDLPGSVCFGSTEFHVIRPETGVLARWIASFLVQHGIRRSAQRAMTGGVGQMRVPTAFLESLHVPIAPTAEQERIADALDELLSDLDAGVTALERVRDKLKLYRAAVLKAAVEGALTGAQSPYRLGPISQGIVSIEQGWSPKCESAPAGDSEWGVIKTTAIQALRYLKGENKRLPAHLIPRPHLELMAGDLLVTRAGPRSRVGVACLVKQTRSGLLLCDKAYRLRCKDNQLLPAFVEVVLNAPQFVDELDKLKTGISDSGVNLTQNRFLELEVPYPALDEQTAIVEAVEDQLSVIDHLDSGIDAKLKNGQALRQSILRHAFSGKLVPQDPNDEPVSELLKRIAAEREQRAREAAAARRLNGHKPRRAAKLRRKATRPEATNKEEPEDGRIADR